MVSLPLKAFAGLNDALFVALKRRVSEAGSFLEFSGLSASLRDAGGGAIASLALSVTEIQKLVEFVEEMARQEHRRWRRNGGLRKRGETEVCETEVGSETEVAAKSSKGS